MYVALALASALFAGATSILAKIGIRDADSDLVTALRTGVVLVCAWGMAALTHSLGGIAQLSPRGAVFLVLSGLCTGASWVCYFRALQKGNVHGVAAIDKSSTVLTMLLAALLLGEPLTGWKLPGMGILAVGTVLMLDWSRAPSGAPRAAGWLLYAILSALFAALTSILTKIGLEAVESNLATALRTTVVLAMAWALVFARGKQRLVRSLDRRTLGFTALSGLATGASWLCYNRALQLGPASVVAPLDKLSILVTVGFACLFLGERLSRRATAGLVLLTTGTFLLLL
ncbi:MAG: EamA family transporter [Candidatus Spyradocola sp.]|jgi:transporter family protein